MSAQLQPDLDSPERIREFVNAFYARLLKDEQLAPIFLNVANIDLQNHLPLICSYWEKLLLGGTDYRRHTMNIHRAVHAKRPLRKADFERWLQYFYATIDDNFAGPHAERAKQVAAHIAVSMHRALQLTQPGTSDG
jgi:hemoglobin